jgi:hypothetical protein
MTKRKPSNYVVVALIQRAGNLILECYGPFKSKLEAQKRAETITYKCLKFVEFMWS